MLFSLYSPYRSLLLLLLLLPVLFYLLPYIRNRPIRRLPGPLLARFSNLWLLYQSRRGRRYLAVHAAHNKYGPLVRIQPEHVSIAHPDAIPIIYSLTGGWTKSNYYDAFLSIYANLFSTRDRAEHTRKRKTLSHTFSAKSIAQFEQYIANDLKELVRQWNIRSDTATRAGEAYADIDSLQWFNYTAFDIIGDLAFGAPFGMLARGKDLAQVQLAPDSPPTYAPAIEVLNRRGEVSATLGCLPSLRPYAKYLPDPFFRNGLKAVENLAGIAVARVNQRLEAQEKGMPQRNDLLARLMESQDEHGNPLGREELTAEALGQLIAGSDTTSNTSCALLYWCLKTKGVMERLQREIDEVVPDHVDVPSFDTVKDLPYLHWVINEALRIHSTASLGLPRVVPPGPGVRIVGHHFPPGTVLSVPTYTIHHSTSVWGPDADSFNPDRWAPGTITDRQKGSFIPFSVGPRACVGRNVAQMELALIVSTVIKGFVFELREEGMETREGFLRKPVRCRVGMRRRGDVA
ncbi:MAG: hypothetical protein L6R40_005423 [Gallowayella cf. fulva]|nr:MAG: hypothetical protein L6R40_005423 [Xanthomendoza cf. fulva]